MENLADIYEFQVLPNEHKDRKTQFFIVLFISSVFNGEKQF